MAGEPSQKKRKTRDGDGEQSEVKARVKVPLPDLLVAHARVCRWVLFGKLPPGPEPRHDWSDEIKLLQEDKTHFDVSLPALADKMPSLRSMLETLARVHPELPSKQKRQSTWGDFWEDMHSIDERLSRDWIWWLARIHRNISIQRDLVKAFLEQEHNELISKRVAAKDEDAQLQRLDELEKAIGELSQPLLDATDPKWWMDMATFCIAYEAGHCAAADE